MNGLLNWIEQRIPMMRVANMHAIQYPAPVNMNFWYVFGFLATIVLVNQIVTGIWLTMNFEPSAERAFASVEYIMREVDYGWLIRYMHSTGASAFFIVVYMHMFRGMIYGSYQLAGRYCVLMPNTARGGGISRKITNAADRKKLKEIATEIDVPTGAGLIIRTAGAKRTKTEIKRDYEYLQRLWEQIRELTLKSIAPAKIYEEGDLIKRSIRDL